MSYRSVFAALLLFGAIQASAQEADFSKTQIRVTSLGGSVYLLEGSGGNIAASVGEDGIVLVDDEFAPLATKIAESLKNLKITDKPVRFIINTHYHYDHTGGNLPFAEGGTTVIAHENARARLATGGTLGNGGPSFHYEQKPAGKGALPVITFEQDVSVHLNGEDIRALHFPAAHTDGDVVIYFPKANVVHMGDVYVRYGFPFIDVEAGGSVQGMIKACEGATAKLPADVKIIPGHGKLSNVTEVRAYVKMLRETSAVVAQALKEGKSLDQMQKEHLLAPWKQLANRNISENGFLETLFASLTHATHAPFIKHN